MALVSNRIEVSDPLDAIEYLYRENMTDGLPVVPPTEKRVQEFLDYVRLSSSHLVGEVPERARVITAEKLAINAVMAGCLPQYMPVLVAAVEALCDPKFEFNHLASMGSPWPLMIVSGPIVKKLNMHSGMYLFGSGNRANATIGRAISLLLWNCCEVRPDVLQRGQLGNPHRYSFCIAENPDAGWQGLNEWEGFPRDTSTVTAFSGYHYCMARSESSTTRAILAPLINAMSRHEFSRGCYVVIIPPNFEKLFLDQGWTKKRIRDYLFENCRRSVADLKEDARWGRNTSSVKVELKDLIPVEKGDADKWVYLFKENPELDPYVFPEGAVNRRADVLIVAAGGDVGITLGLLQPYSQSTTPVTKPVSA